METTINERIRKVLKHYDVSENSLASTMGISQTTVNSALKSDKNNVSSKIIVGICKAFPELNVNWLLTGEGQMTRVNESTAIMESHPQKKSDVYTVPVVPTEAMAGTLGAVSESVDLAHCRRIPCPVPDADFAIPVTGNSMEPEIPSGSMLYIKRLNERAFIPWGHTIVIDTANGVVVKKVFPSKSEEHITAISVNKDYPPLEIEKDSIYGMYRVLGQSFFNATF